MDTYKKIYYCVFKYFYGCVFIVSPTHKPLLSPFAEVLMKVVLKPWLHFQWMQCCTAHHRWTLAVEVCSVLIWLRVRCKVWWRGDCVSGVGLGLLVPVKGTLCFSTPRHCCHYFSCISVCLCVSVVTKCHTNPQSLVFELTRNDSYRSTYVCELLPGEVFDQAADQGAFPDLRGANNDNHNWRRLQGSPVYNRHVVFFGFYVLGPFWGTNKNKHQHSLKTWTWLILLCNA